jgi:undecaprenyl-diphosphatase
MIETFEMTDRALFLAINSLHHPFLDTLMWYASKTWPTIVLALICAYFFYRRFPRKALAFALGCLIVSAATDLSANALKHGVARYRPTHNTEIGKSVRVLNDYRGGKYGFASGHAANTFGVTMFVFLCMNWVRKPFRLLFFLYPALVAYSRIYLGVHYPSDVIFGSIHGMIFGWLGYLVMNAYFFKSDEGDTRDTAAA